MEWASCCGGKVETSHDGDKAYWRRLKYQLDGRQSAADKAAIAVKLEETKRQLAEDIAARVVVEPWRANEEEQIATNLGINLENWWHIDNSRQDDVLEIRENETEDDFWLRLAAFCEAGRDHSFQPADCYPAAWQVDRPLIKHGGTISPKAFYAPDSDDYWLLPVMADGKYTRKAPKDVWHRRSAGIHTLVCGEADQYTIEPLPPDGGAYILNGRTNVDCLPEQLATIKQDAIEALGDVLANHDGLARLIALNEFADKHILRNGSYKLLARRDFVSDTTDTKALADKARQARLAAYLERH